MCTGRGCQGWLPPTRWPTWGHPNHCTAVGSTWKQNQCLYSESCLERPLPLGDHLLSSVGTTYNMYNEQSRYPVLRDHCLEKPLVLKWRYHIQTRLFWETIAMQDHLFWSTRYQYHIHNLAVLRDHCHERPPVLKYQYHIHNLSWEITASWRTSSTYSVLRDHCHETICF